MNLTSKPIKESKIKIFISQYPVAKLTFHAYPAWSNSKSTKELNRNISK
jgi:hypothetical protein